MKIQALAHRGYPVKYPENTLASYRAAYELGFSHLEIDVHLSKDGIPVLMHDTKINRTTNGQGYIKDFTLKELKCLDAGEEETIPTLKEALEFAKGRMFVSIELKQQGDLYPGLEEKALQVIQEMDMLDQVYVNSFDHYAVMRMRQLSDDIDLGIIQHGASPAVLPFMKKIRAHYLSLRVEYLTGGYVEACHEAGARIVVWPVDTEEQFLKVLQHPSVLSTTNQLERFKSLYEQYVIQKEES
ncbi:glycerophosphoryl diester phosphodiesterase [Pullulanibacillus camelliae]|uniref:Glycerophosphoryl diester phosphodiesterase n=1 Tax=Pullulanibacillus camelliae TaxID=1707096 RepID=A0A8J3DYJ1_9BACL|nr:glycerophosphodiester phosphodiesterase family protein [Pullulanibacillus camelliae]GGE47433.1 glycerophosphoryl diester phosphodiesterase [Pullulanibacillus camelliae]